MEWKVLEPNEQGDWISMRNESFDSFIPIEPEKKFDIKSNTLFNTYIIGIATNRDAWVNNFSSKEVLQNMELMISNYNKQREEFEIAKQKNPNLEFENFLDASSTKISWTRALRRDASNNVKHQFKTKANVQCLYRPFTKQNLYYDKPFIESPGLSSKIFPNGNYSNVQICITGVGGTRDFSVLVSNQITDLQVQFNGQIFPLYYYEENKDVQQGLFETGSNEEYIRRDAVSDYILDKATKQYNATNITKEDIFYYVYGFLHSPEYREMFANDLKKMLPRLPLVEDVKDFWTFSKAGRELSELHLNYETVSPYEGVNVVGEESNFFKVEKMRFPKKDQKDTIHYNSCITISNIPSEAYEYVVNGKSAIEWIMERYQITTHKESQITNDPNDWAEEVGNPRYILDLLLSIINVSMQTRELVGKLPKVKFD